MPDMTRRQEVMHSPAVGSRGAENAFDRHRQQTTSEAPVGVGSGPLSTRGAITSARNTLAESAMSIFERYLTLWVALCIVAGIALGQLLPGAFPGDRRGRGRARSTCRSRC